MGVDWIRRRVNWPNLLIAALLIIDLFVAILTLKSHGMSWDEPLFYNYADSIGNAYSISARLNGTLDLNKAYGSDPEGHKVYGPAYLLLARPLTLLLERIPGIQVADAWHLVNFLTFQIGVLIFYLLAKRWVNAWAALFASAFFATQPLLWGHAFINPKDIPFTVFFILAVYFGFRLADSLKITRVAAPSAQTEGNIGKDRVMSRRVQIAGRIALILGIVSGVIAAVLFAAGRWVEQGVDTLVRRALTLPAASLLRKIFNLVAPNSSGRVIDPYVVKALAAFHQARLGLLVVCLLLVALAIILAAWRERVAETLRLIRHTAVSPLWLALASIFAGLATSIRVIGPLASALISIYLLARYGRRTLGVILLYAVIAIVVCYVTWPYIWSAPIGNFINSIHFMADNPTPKPVLYNGVIFLSDDLPVFFLPKMLAITLTEPVWVLFVLGVIGIYQRFRREGSVWKSLLVPVGWFLVPFIYVVIFKPAIYDGIRQFLFMLPGIFLVIAFGFQALLDGIRLKWVNILLAVALLAPGIVVIVRLSPYEYAYYNTFTGGIGGAFRKYDTDFWLTCYKDTMQSLDATAPAGTTVFVLRNPSLAQVYTTSNLNVVAYQRQPDNTTPGSLLLLTTRANSDLLYHAGDPVYFQLGRDGATFCVVKQVK
jgi:hypothetical protein